MFTDANLLLYMSNIIYIILKKTIFLYLKVNIN